jgi:hypothetical protein
MLIQHKFSAISLLLGVSLLLLPAAQAKGLDTYDAYEDLSGTHANTVYDTKKSGMLGREGMEGETGPSGKTSVRTMRDNMNVYDAYEELSGTHATKRTFQSGAQGRSGAEGSAGLAGSKSTEASPLFRIPGDVENGCSKYLRCTGEY